MQGNCIAMVGLSFKITLLVDRKSIFIKGTKPLFLTQYVSGLNNSYFMKKALLLLACYCISTSISAQLNSVEDSLRFYLNNTCEYETNGLNKTKRVKMTYLIPCRWESPKQERSVDNLIKSFTTYLNESITLSSVLMISD